MESVLAFIFEQRIPAGIAYALVVPVGLAQRAFILHAAFAHHCAGAGVTGVVAAIETIVADNIEEIVHDGLKGF